MQRASKFAVSVGLKRICPGLGRWLVFIADVVGSF